MYEGCRIGRNRKVRDMLRVCEKSGEYGKDVTRVNVKSMVIMMKI